MSACTMTLFNACRYLSAEDSPSLDTGRESGRTDQGVDSCLFFSCHEWHCCLLCLSTSSIDFHSSAKTPLVAVPGWLTWGQLCTSVGVLNDKRVAKPVIAQPGSVKHSTWRVAKDGGL